MVRMHVHSPAAGFGDPCVPATVPPALKLLSSAVTRYACAAGFGFPCVAATVFFPLHIGAALANLLFPVFILVACASDPLAAQSELLTISTIT